MAYTKVSLKPLQKIAQLNVLYLVWFNNQKWKEHILRNPYTSFGGLCAYNEAGKPGSKTKRG